MEDEGVSDRGLLRLLVQLFIRFVDVSVAHLDVGSLLLVGQIVDALLALILGGLHPQACAVGKSGRPGSLSHHLGLVARTSFILGSLTDMAFHQHIQCTSVHLLKFAGFLTFQLFDIISDVVRKSVAMLLEEPGRVGLEGGERACDTRLESQSGLGVGFAGAAIR